MRRCFFPWFVLIGLTALIAVGLTVDPSLVTRPLDKPAPAFSLPQVIDAGAMMGNTDWNQRVVVLNVWASWCVSCRLEHEVLMKLARSDEVPVYGLNYKDQRHDAVRWLEYYGNPYVASAFDADGRVGVALGVYGVPETFVIDGEGIIRYRHTGPIDERAVTEEIMPLLQELRGEGA
ncbi:MAG: DsbE family thiol:disulfide interchange protein [Betaproteobacteria bacterium]|jgi:cytochrome c biogenesis protein CcmG/thiol:disulfide interchange protein DsbE|nr:MAG: DsbE family thiol:disulfide interchange protein [Betaproteobacteria bacterium]